MMVEGEDEVVVSIEAEPPVEGGTVVDTAKPNGAATADPKESLKAQFEQAERVGASERAARLAAEQRASAAEQAAADARKEVETARVEVTDSQLGTIESGMAAAKAEAEAAEREHQAAFEAGDSAKVSASQRKMARAEAKLVRLDEARAEIESRPKKQAEDTVRRTEAPQRPAPADPVEAYIANRTEPTQNWLRAHREFITDPRKNQKLTAAHHDAVADGLVPDTKEYFDHVETFIGIAKTNGADPAPAKPAVVRRAAPPAAPVGASAGGTNGGGTEVRLSRTEAAAAVDGTHQWNYDDPSGQKRFKKGDPIGVQEFARRKLEMTKQGLYDKSFIEA